MDLSISRVYGTSSNGPLTVAITTNLVGYIASGGVVVSEIRVEGEKTVLTNQRFFCASQNKPAPSTPTKMFNHEPNTSKDLYGVPKPSAPVFINGFQNSNDSLSSSPPKPSPQQPSVAASKLKRLKSISSIAISPDEKLLAVGETGNQPRIHIFSLAPDSTNTPIISIQEHNFGVHALKFSPNSQNLLSLGLPHDGFIFVWRIAGLQVDCVAVNKCTSMINGVEWLNDEDFITYGIRHAKFWKFEEIGKPREVLQGKNVVLNNFINCNFVCLDIVTMEGGEVSLFFLSSVGDICWYDPEQNSMKLKYKFEDGRSVGSVLFDYEHGKVWFGDQVTSIKSLSLNEIDNFEVEKTNSHDLLESPSKSHFSPSIPFMHRFPNDGIFYITVQEEIKHFDTKTLESTNLIEPVLKSSTGLKIASNSEIYIWTKTGHVQRIHKGTFNLEHTASVKPVETPNCAIENHITALDITADEEIITGDAYGNLAIYSVTGDIKFTIQAHEFRINDVTYFKIKDVEFIVSIGKDRMIQILTKSSSDKYKDVTSSWNILATLNFHKGNLLKVMISNTNRIYTSSADRSISVHEIKIVGNEIEIENIKSLTFKSSPSAFQVHENELFVSTMDKQIMIYNTANWEIINTFKLPITDTDSALVDNMSITSQGYILCTCSDNTIRVFTRTTMKQLAANWGHSEPIKSLILQEPDAIILTNNGRLFKWTLITEPAQGSGQRSADVTPKVTRKIKPFSTPVGSSIKKNNARSTSPIRSPSIHATNPTPSRVATRLQNTAKLTPPRLSSTTKVDLSPSLTANTSSNSMSPSFRRLSTVGKVASSPSSRCGTPKRLALSQVSLPSPNAKGRSILSVRAMPSDDEESDTDEKIQVDELLSMLKKFKKKIGEYSYDEVIRVKREIDDIFNSETELIQKYSELLIQRINSAQK